MHSHRTFRSRGLFAVALAGLVSLSALIIVTVNAQNVDKSILEAEAKRVAVVEKVKPAVVAIFSAGGQGGGSGVLVSKDGFAITNFHVVQGSGPVMKCGLPDGVLYDAVLVGLDKVGDVALVKLLPKKPNQEFPLAPMGDSDKVKAGDWSLAMGNPFLLATDFTPTVTYGLVSGVHRYQHPAGILLEYTDCIQIDTSINPGNSGGPLFNMDGEIIGINGRGSFEKRGRVNSGVGYAISINQIKNFMGHLHAGLDADHASTGFRVETMKEEGSGEQLIVRSILEDCDARRRGLDTDDELVGFAGRPITSLNQYKNVLGLYPKGWRMPLVYRRKNDKKEILVRLMGVQPQEMNDGQPKPNQPQPTPQPQAPPIPNTPAKKLYIAKPGFANFYFNKQQLDRVLAASRKHGDFTALTGAWRIEAEAVTKAGRRDVVMAIAEEKDKDAKSPKTVVRLNMGTAYTLEPLKIGQEIDELLQPAGSGGLMVALYQLRRFLVLGQKGFEGDFHHGGHEPLYPPPVDGSTPRNIKDLRIDAEVIRTEHSAVVAKWYFSLKDQTLLAFEVQVDKEKDPCEVYLSDYRMSEGRLLPHRWEVRYGDDRFAVLNIKSYQLAAAK